MGVGPEGSQYEVRMLHRLATQGPLLGASTQVWLVGSQARALTKELPHWLFETQAPPFPAGFTQVAPAAPLLRAHTYPSTHPCWTQGCPAAASGMQIDPAFPNAQKDPSGQESLVPQGWLSSPGKGTAQAPLGDAVPAPVSQTCPEGHWLSWLHESPPCAQIPVQVLEDVLALCKQ